MTVKELRDKLSKIDEHTRVVVYVEDDRGQIGLFEIEDVSTASGIPGRLEDGKAGFTFDRNGPAAWLFIRVVPA